MAFIKMLWERTLGVNFKVSIKNYDTPEVNNIKVNFKVSIKNYNS